MDPKQTAATCHAPGQTPVRTWLSSSSKGAPSDTTSRFHGDGVRYKAKLIGVDSVPDAQGDKMCWDSMMKLKGFDAAARKQGKHKQRVWLKVSSGGLRIVDERTGAVLHDHEWSRISSLTKDESDPRALAYVYRHQDAFSLFYVKTANLAEPVLVDMEAVCQIVEPETPGEPEEAPAQTGSLLLINDSSNVPAEGPAFMDIFSPRTDSPSGPSNPASPSSELMEVFSVQMEEPLLPDQSSCSSQLESQQPTLSASQILSMYPTRPAVGSSQYSSPPYSPTTMPWGQQQGILGNQWVSGPAPVGSSWSTMAGGMEAWGPAGHQMAQSSQLGFMMGGNAPTSPASPTSPAPPTSPTAANGFPDPLKSLFAPPAGATGSPSVPPNVDHDNPFF